jgi:hypothetical protein
VTEQHASDDRVSRFLGMPSGRIENRGDAATLVFDDGRE